MAWYMVSNKIRLERADHIIPTISGVFTTGQVGTLALAGGDLINGVAASTALGTVNKVLTKTLTGASATGATGTLVPKVTPTSTGTVASGAIGSVTISAGTPVGDVDIDLTQAVLDSRFTCTRASDKWAWNNLGILTNYSTNSWPLDHDPANGNAPIGRRYEKAATNLAWPSNDFTHANWTKGISTTVTGSFATGPNGNATSAARLVMPATSGTVVNYAFSAVTGTKYTFSIFAKNNGASSLRIGFSTSANGGDLGSTDVVTQSNWRRYSTTWTSTVTGTAFVQINNGESNANSVDVLIFGAQLETGPVATSYIPTTTTTVTRAADYVTLDVSFLGESAGTIVLEYDLEQLIDTGAPHLIHFADGDDSNYIKLYFNPIATSGNNDIWGKVQSNNLTTVDQSVGQAVDTSVTQKAGIAYQLNDTISGHNSVVSTLDSSCAMPTANLTVAAFGSRVNGTDQFPMIAKRFRYRTTRRNTTIFQNEDIFVTAPPVSGNKLRYNPNIRVPLDPGFSVYNIGSGSLSTQPHTSIQLDAGEHAKIIINNGTGVYNGTLGVRGVLHSDNRVWIIGGQIQSRKWNATAFTLLGIDHCYVEGVWINKNHYTGDAVALAGGGGYWFQNCLITGPNYSDTNNGDNPTGPHGDTMQVQSHTKYLHLHRVTMYGWHQGFLFNNKTSTDLNRYTAGTPTIVDTTTWRDVNIRCYRSRYNPKAVLQDQITYFHPKGSVMMHFGDNDSYPPVKFAVENMWIWDDQTVTETYVDMNGNTTTDSRRGIHNLIRPNPAVSSADNAWYGTIAGDNFTGTYTLHPLLGTGFVQGGVPPGGDFVNGGDLQYGLVNTGPTHLGAFSGLNYVSPGYLE